MQKDVKVEKERQIEKLRETETDIERDRGGVERERRWTASAHFFV